MSASAILTNGTMVLAKTWGETDMTGGKGEEFGKAAPFGLFLILALLVATVFLIRSMNRRLRNLPESFDDVDGAKGRDAHALNNASPMDDALPRGGATGAAGTSEPTVTMIKDQPRPDAER